MTGARRLLARLAAGQTRDAVEEATDDAFMLLGLLFVGVGFWLVSVAAAFAVVGALMLALVTVPRLILLWRNGDDRE